jgi:hypothetical protein
VLSRLLTDPCVKLRRLYLLARILSETLGGGRIQRTLRFWVVSQNTISRATTAEQGAGSVV